jgi:Domain of unknown function (DUF6894)
MPLYTFALRDGSCRVEDDSALYLEDRAQALNHAHKVARELMAGREKSTRCWRLEVYEDRAVLVDDILFASLDASLDHLPPDWRGKVENLSERLLLLKEAISMSRLVGLEARALVAQSRGRPYLAVVHGRRTISAT